MTDDDLRDATTWFPLVGLVVGGLGALVLVGLWGPLGPTVASVLAVAATVLATGAFHEDGWADTFDGLWGGWTPERRIEIMRDSRVGTYGALALVLAVVLQVGALATFPSAVTAALALPAAHALGRWSILLQIRRSPAATDQGSGARVADPISLPRFGVATLVAVPSAAVLTVDGFSGQAAIAWSVVGVLASVELVARVARRKVGGVTGDQLGATAMLSTLVVLLVLVALRDLP